MSFLSRIFGKPQPLTDAQQAQVDWDARLSQIVETTRHSYATQRFIRAREAALKANTASRRTYADGIDAWFARGGK